MKHLSTFILTLAVFFIFSNKAIASPFLKAEKRVITEVDSLKKTKSELHVYSYAMLNAYGFIGTYTELYVYNFQDVLLSLTQKSMTTPYMGNDNDYKVKQKKTFFDFSGNKTQVIKTVKMSNDVVYKKEKKILFSEDGHRSVHSIFYDVKTSNDGYHQPSKVQLFLHNFKSKKSHQ